jgi:hypothetical protein
MQLCKIHEINNIYIYILKIEVRNGRSKSLNTNKILKDNPKIILFKTQIGFKNP